jgi:hypothetical protein
VIAEDGITYEREVIEKWFKTHKTSPATGSLLSSNNLISNLFVKKYINDYFVTHPKEKINQYVCAIKTIADIKHYNIKDLIVIAPNDLSNICKLLSLNELIYLIKNVNDVNAKLQNDSRLIHFICQSSMQDLVIHIIEHYLNNNLSIECVNTWGFCPIHYICEKSTKTAIIYICNIYVVHELNIECETKNKIKPIHVICEHSTSSTIEHILNIYENYDYNLNCKTNKNDTPESIIKKRFTHRCTVYKHLKKIQRKKTPKKSCCEFSFFNNPYDGL